MPEATLRFDDPSKRDIKVAQFEIENEDTFHLKNLYKRVYEWLLDEGWVSADGGDENFEVMYWQRSNTSGAQEHHVWWRAFRIPDKNSYYRYFLKIDFQTLNVKKIEVMHKGQKMGTNKGDTIIRVTSYLQLDYNDGFENTALLKPIHGMFRKRMYAEEISGYKKDLYDATYRLHTTIKQYLMLKPIIADWGRSFHPERGI